jgi:hypothetical protein
MLAGVGVGDLAHQHFDEEIAGLPGKFSPSLGGRLFVAVLVGLLQ